MPAQPSIGKAKLIGAQAGELLSAPDFSGRILAVVSNAVYLVGTDDAIVWLAQAKLPAHPRSVLGGFDLSALRVGMCFRRQESRLQFDDQVSLDLADASVWQPAAIPPGKIARREIVRACVRELLAQAQSFDFGENLGQAIPMIAAIANGGDATMASSSALVASALCPIKEIACACRDRDMAHIVATARALVGLGHGLTPSGDDFLGGLFFVAHHLNATYPREFRWEQKPIDDLLDWARTQTNPISHTILCDHARGQGAEPLHDLVAAILKGKEPDEIMRHAQRLLSIGSTSGWDIFTGAVTGMLLG